MAEVKEINLMADGREVILLQGKAPEPLPTREPVAVHLSGDLKCVAAFLAVRKGAASGLQVVDTTKAVVEANYQKRSIRLRLDPENYYGSTVTGTLELDEELQKLGLNANRTMNREELTKLLKFTRIWFSDRDQYNAVMEAVGKVKFAASLEVANAKDNAGNRSSSFDQRILDENGFIRHFTLSIPVFKGYDKEKIQVEICTELNSNGVLFWLESIDLFDMIKEAGKRLMDDELKACDGLVIIRN